MKHPRQQSAEHRKRVAQLGCIVCGDDVTTEAAHVRYSDLRAGKLSTGMAEKSSDCFVVPLCGRHHREQHSMNEREFWRDRGIDPVKAALALWHWRDDFEMCARIVSAHRAND